MSISLVRRARELAGVGNDPEFAPSAALLHQFARARRLNRNVRGSSSFNPRLHRRASQAAMGVRALDAHERRTFKASTEGTA